MAEFPDLPDPLVPVGTDLRNFPFMPIDIARLFGSRFHAIANGDEWRAGVTLWLKSFHQVTAGSIPDDDIELARLAEYGRDMRGWKKVRAVALHGWILCSDGRFYHPVVAEKVLEAARKKEAFRERSRKANEKRWAKNNSGDESPSSSGTGQDEKPDAGSDDRAGENGGKAATAVDQQYPSAIPLASNKDTLGSPSASQQTGTGTGTGTGIKEKNTPQAASSPEDHLWTAGKSFLISRGVSASRVGGLIGKWKRDYGVAATIEAIGVAQVEPNLVDPVPFVTKVLKQRNANDPDDPRTLGEMRFASPC